MTQAHETQSRKWSVEMVWCRKYFSRYVRLQTRQNSRPNVLLMHHQSKFRPNQ